MNFKQKLNEWWCGFTTGHYPREKKIVYSSTVGDIGISTLSAARKTEVIGWVCSGCGMLLSAIDELEEKINE